MARCGAIKFSHICALPPDLHVQHWATGGFTWPNLVGQEAYDRQQAEVAAAKRDRLRGAKPSGRVLRDEAMDRVERAANPEFNAEARRVLAVLAVQRAEITSEDVEDVLDARDIRTHDNRAMGPIMTWAQRAGLIEKADPERFVKSRRAERHLMDIRVWRSLVHQPDLSR